MATNSCDLPAKALDPRILGPTRTSFEQLPLSQQLQYTVRLSLSTALACMGAGGLCLTAPSARANVAGLHGLV
jgi:hypothetical protein